MTDISYSIVQARARLGAIARRVAATREPVAITDHGQPVAIPVGPADALESEETRVPAASRKRRSEGEEAGVPHAEALRRIFGDDAWPMRSPGNRRLWPRPSVSRKTIRMGSDRDTRQRGNGMILKP
ncbi:type II toxin-antitoxin system Phd/YefM family antitoxin [Streptomyces sp. ST2-7A]|uniref:type II toxin-antitoxin system Phd/YefM family antitoxin n=1 Tax=Streptomyces sp. ST2-7A TaxID=2907214 RepID=UPI001F23C944|nr:type II toxin-antitoxin system Phd/YefM family antitoxin [Streptomyces sp. ST2-7A]MCE7082866.1 type II toxin-antitoxin system Phd/YefM family antitoxin [Streptomyces sp. ST2-7A]